MVHRRGEAIMWKRLHHKNIVPLLGITTAPLQLVSKWMPDGNLMEHIGKHSDANQPDLVSVPPIPLCPILTFVPTI